MDDDLNGPPPGGMDEEPRGLFNTLLTQDFLVCSIIMCIVAIVGLVGNSLMLRAWIKYPNLRNDFYTVFAFLSLADMVFLAISVPARIADMMDSEVLNTVAWCKYSRYLINACGFIAAYLLVALATLRAILLTNRNTFLRPRSRHLAIFSIASYVVVFCISIPIISMYTSFHGYCYFNTDQDEVKQTWLLDSFSAFVPLFLVFLLYFIAYILGKRYFADSYSLREKQKSRLVNSVVVAFMVCQLPYRIVSIYGVYVDPSDEEANLKILTSKDYLMCLVMAGKVVRPILCSKLTTDLGHAFDEIINCQGCNKTYHRANDGVIETEVPPTVAVSPSETDPDPDPEPPSPLQTSPGFRVAVDRSISTSSSASTNSQTPLVRNPSPPSEIEMA